MSTVANPWTKKANSSEGGDFELPPGGAHPAVLVGMIDLGTTESEYQGKKKDRHKILLVWELTGEHNSKGEPFFVSRDFTFSMNKKADLRSFVEGWLGHSFKDDEDVDLSVLMNTPCVVNLAAGTSAGGKKIVDVASVTRPMKGLAVPPQSVEPLMWTFEGWDLRQDPPIPEWVPRLYGRKVADDIKQSKEWSQLNPF